MKDCIQKYKMLIVIVSIVLAIIITMIIRQSLLNNEIESLIQIINEEISELSTILNSSKRQLTIDDNWSNDFKRHFFNYKWKLTSKNSFTNYGGTSFFILLSNEYRDSILHFLGDKYVIITTHDFVNSNTRTYQLEVKWNGESFEEVKQLIRQ